MLKNIIKNYKIYIQKILKIFFILFFIFIFFSLINYFYISNYSKRYITYNVNELPWNKVGLLLGTSPFTNSGERNIYFKNRIDATKNLFENEKIDFILVSGDNREINYNEPKYMKNHLEKNNIPSAFIISDYAGRRTLDSVLRSEKIFNQKHITIISQKFHNERAVFIARKNNIDAIAFNAEDIKKEDFENIFHYFYIKSKNIFREILARNIAIFDILINKQPEILGDIIEIK